MKNRNVGFLIVGIAILIGVIILLFNSGLKDIVGQTCDHETECEMYDTISLQTNLSLAVAGLVLLIGLFFIFARESEKIIVRRIKEKVRKKKINLAGLDKSEREVVGILEREKGAIFQKSLMEELGVGKVKITRMMDRLESKGIIERKRRGMNNIIVLVN